MARGWWNAYYFPCSRCRRQCRSRARPRVCNDCRAAERFAEAVAAASAAKTGKAEVTRGP